MPRKYTKKSAYWSNLSKKEELAPVVAFRETPSLQYKWDDHEHFSAMAACGGGSGSTSYRDQGGASAIPIDAYRNINSGMLPWEQVKGNLTVNRAITLTQKAYFNVAIVRNTIESCVEFSNSPIHVKTSNETVKAFFTEWFNKINIGHLKDNFFREYYRSGNVFLYKFVGKIEEEQFGKMKSAFGAKSNILPIRYVILNPAQIYLEGGIGYKNSQWTKILSTYEIQRLSNPQTNEDRQIFNSLPAATKQQIRAGSSYQSLFMPLDPSRLYYVFYKKQDYEPLAIPMVFPVLNDIEQKLELKKMDMSLSRTIEHVILLVTTGEKTDQYGGGINVENLSALQNIFQKQTLGRTLVADYTTKGEWLVPPIDKILGPEKYQQVESDIREGLQSILVGDDKFANATIKAKIFIERMKEGQRAFMTEFLIPEAKRICEAMGFRHMPEFEFESISLDDPTNMNRVYIRMAELGIITPEQLITALDSGVLPDAETLRQQQEEYKKMRDKGFYYPLVGGSKPNEDGGRPSGTKSPQTKKSVSPIGTKASIEDKFSTMKVAELTIKAGNLLKDAEKEMAKKFKLKELNDAQKSVTASLVKSLLINEEEGQWTTAKLKEYIKAPKEINSERCEILDELAMQHDLTEWQAAILDKSRL